MSEKWQEKKFRKKNDDKKKKKSTLFLVKRGRKDSSRWKGSNAKRVLPHVSIKGSLVRVINSYEKMKHMKLIYRGGILLYNM